MHFILSEQEENVIRPFCNDKHFTAVVHFRFGCKTLKNHFDDTLHFSPFSQFEQCRLEVMNNLWKFQCCAADNKAYRTVRTSYVNCMHKAEFQWFSWWQCLPSCYYVTETRSPNEANHLKVFVLNLGSQKHLQTNKVQMDGVSVEYFIL